MKILYAGSPEAAKTTLEILFNNQKEYGFEIAGVLTNPPSAKGRHKELVPTPVGQFAQEKGLPVFTPEHLDAACREQIAPLNADLLVCFAYGHIFGPKFLSLFPLGGINLHPSYLPQYRGCSPVQQALLDLNKNKDPLLGVSIQKLALEMDAGDLLAQDTILISDEDNYVTLLQESAVRGAKLILSIIKNADEKGALPQGNPQTGTPSFTKTITKQDAKINWENDAEDIALMVRAYYQDPCCWCLENGQPLKILKAQAIPENDSVWGIITKTDEYKSMPCGKVIAMNNQKPDIYIKTGNGILHVLELQRSGKSAMESKAFLNGARNFIGSVLQ